MSLLTNIATLLDSPNAEVKFNLSSAGGDDVRLLITPSLGAQPSNITDEEAALRSALAQPIVIKGTADSVEQQLTDYLSTYKPVRARAVSALDNLMAAANAAESASKGGSKASSDDKSVGDNAEEESSTPSAVPTDTPNDKPEKTDNLFGGAL